jgi:hypothetical protein
MVQLAFWLSQLQILNAVAALRGGRRWCSKHQRRPNHSQPLESTMATLKNNADSAARLDPIPLNNLPASPHGQCTKVGMHTRTAA